MQRKICSKISYLLGKNIRKLQTVNQNKSAIEYTDAKPTGDVSSRNASEGRTVATFNVDINL